MTLWSNTNSASSAPKYKIGGATEGSALASANGVQLYGNTTVGAFNNDAEVGVFGVSSANVSNSTYTGAAHAGWLLRRAGTGPLATIAVANTGAKYNANASGFVTFSGSPGSGANASWTANSGGYVTTVTLNTGGSDYDGTGITANTGSANTPNVANAGSYATFTLGFGGRAGRITYETLVAAGSVTG